MRTTRRSAKFAALAVGLSLIAAACGDDDDDNGADDTTATSAESETTAAEVTPSTTAPPATTEAPDTTTEATDEPDTTAVDTTDGAGDDPAPPAGDAAMRVTVDLNPDANWSDGTPITVADIACTWEAYLNTPGSLSTVGYDQISSVEPGESDKQAIIEFSTIYAGYKGLFNTLFPAHTVENCSDVSTDFADIIEVSGGPYKLDSWSPSGSTWVPDEEYAAWGSKPANFDQVAMVPLADSDTEIAAIKAGEVDFIYPQPYSGMEAALEDPNIEVIIGFGGQFEGLYFQQLEGPLADPVFREAFSKSIDRQGVFDQIYVPIVSGAEMLNCGPIVPGQFCPDNDVFGETYDPEGAAALLEENGWTMNADGMWESPDGEVPEIRWIVNTGNTRRESTQAFLIPLLQELGFNVVPDNCDAACYFQQRLPALDYDLAMYISTVTGDPSYLSNSYRCDQIPTEENGNIGQNNTGWCNEEAHEVLQKADVEIDSDARAELIQEFLPYVAQDFVMLPLYQFPTAGAYRTDKVGGPVGEELNGYWAFRNFGAWEDLDGDGTLVIGAEQWPECLNPITECSNSSWYQWTVGFPAFPAIWDPTNDGGFELTDVAASEPVVEVL